MDLSRQMKSKTWAQVRLAAKQILNHFLHMQNSSWVFSSAFHRKRLARCYLRNASTFFFFSFFQIAGWCLIVWPSPGDSWDKTCCQLSSSLTVKFPKAWPGRSRFGGRWGVTESYHQAIFNSKLTFYTRQQNFGTWRERPSYAVAERKTGMHSCGPNRGIFIFVWSWDPYFKRHQWHP